MSLALLVGLGNPGPRYAHTRHNAGVWWLEEVAQTLQINFRVEKKFQSLYASIEQAQTRIHLLLPQTFMNLSGDAVLACAQFYKIAPEQILVAHDELDLPVGTLRLKQGGGHGGHNGLRDLSAKLPSSQYHRLRIGIGRPSDASADIADYVLNAPSKTEFTQINAAFLPSLKLLPELLTGQMQAVMRKLHTNS